MDVDYGLGAISTREARKGESSQTELLLARFLKAGRITVKHQVLARNEPVSQPQNKPECI